MAKLLSIFAFAFSLCLMSCGDDTKVENHGKTVVMSVEDSLEFKIRQNPSDPLVYLERAKYYRKESRFKSALEDLQKAIRRDSMNADFFYMQGKVYLDLERISDAKASLEKVIVLAPGHTDAFVALSKIYYSGWRYKDAIEYADQALKIDKFKSSAYFWKGMSFKELGDTVKAKSSFQTAIEQNPDHTEAYMQLGRLYGAENDSTALLYFNNVLAVNPKNIDALYSMGMFYQYNEKMERAIEKYKKIIEIDVENIDAHFNIGTIYAEYIESYDTALVYYERILRVNPDLAKAVAGKAYCFEKMGKREDAIRLYKKAIEIDPEYALPVARLNAMGV